jgi:hypothetical protein
MTKKEVFTPFFIASNDADFGPRLGGNPPKGVRPRHQSELTKYLMTVPLKPGMEASIFMSFDFDNDGPANPFDMCGVLFEESNSLVEVVFHSPSERDSSSSIPSDIPGHKLTLMDAEVIENIDELSEFHKFGGEPTFLHEHNSMFIAECWDLLRSDYQQLVQLAFPVGPCDTVIDSDWPFGEYIFHLFIAFEKGTPRYKYCWG